MTGIDAYYFDGKSSKRTGIKLYLDLPGTIRIIGLNIVSEVSYDLADVRVSPRIGSTPRSIYLPENAKLEVADNTAVDAFLKSSGSSSFQGFVHMLERNLIYALASLLITGICAWAFIEYGIPTLAKKAAFALPAETSSALGSDGLRLLDRIFFKPSELSEEKKDIYREHFYLMTRDLNDTQQTRLVFRKSKKMGANAFTLPSGIILFTDELIELSEDDYEVVSIMAHEVGHVVERHSIRHLLQSSVVALLITTLTGDVTSITALSATLPTLLIESKFSKEFEVEADDYSYNYLKKTGIPTIHFANIMERMSKARGGEQTKLNYLSSHPSTADRIERFKDN